MSYGTNGANLAILIGQSCEAGLVNVPTPDTGTVPIYSWTVTGTTFQQWSNTTPALPSNGNVANPNASYYVGGINLNNPASPVWCWDDLTQTSETVSCTVTVVVGGVSTTLSAKPVTVLVCVPLFSGYGTPGYVQINKGAPGDGGYEIWAGPTSTTDTSNRSGITWHCTLTTPQVPVAFGLGKAEFVQIITSNNSYTAYTYTYDDPNDGITGLDTSYPYDNYTYLEGSTTPFSDGDSPGFSIYEEDTFVTLGLSASL